MLKSLLYFPCRLHFYQKFSSLPAFCTMRHDKVHHQLLAKGALLIKDAQSLDPVAYSDFISELVALRKRI